MNAKMKMIAAWIDSAALRDSGPTSVAVEAALRDLLDSLGDLPENFSEAGLYQYPVPLQSDDGNCSLDEELAPTLYDLGGVLGGISEATTRKLRLLDQLVERAIAVTGASWLGIYQRRQRFDGTEVLVKLAYRGRVSRAEFPLTVEFARASTNSAVGLSGKAQLIDDVAAHVQNGGAYYVCDAEVQSEACFPIFGASQTVVGIVDAEAAPKLFFTRERQAVLAAVCLMAPGLLP